MTSPGQNVPGAGTPCDPKFTFPVICIKGLFDAARTESPWDWTRAAVSQSELDEVDSTRGHGSACSHSVKSSDR